MRGQGPSDPTLLALRTLGGDPLMEEARRRFEFCAEWESNWRKKFLDDLKFAEADSYNGYQWPDDIRHTRDLNDRPSLTINVVRQHNIQIVNEARRNKASAKIMGMGNGATQESANIIKSIIRHIEFTSKAQRNCYTPARGFQVKGGIGWWRLLTDYESNDSFDQEIFIAPVADPLSVYMDPNCQKMDCSDAKFAFIFSILPHELVDALVPNYSALGAPKMPLGLAPGESFFVEKDHVVVCEYFRKVPKPDQLISFMVGGERKLIRRNRLPEDAAVEIVRDPMTMTRDIVDEEVEWKLIVGELLADETIWPGKYIPLVRCIGEETVIEGILDRKGHTRAMQDAQRMLNYNASAQVEFGALQTKAPWVAPKTAIEGVETYWNTANTENHSVLPWNDVDENNPDRQVPPPFKTDPPQTAPAFESGFQTAFNQMMMASGQWQNQMGMMGNERTGAAIDKRLQQGDTATFHFEDNYEDALVYTYEQIIDLIPKIYDTRRVKHILADDGTDFELEIDPQAQQVFVQEMNHQNEVIRTVLNPALGKYGIAPDVGPDIKTKRRETVDALTMILTEAPVLTNIIGDILLRNLEFDDAQEAAMRLKRLVPPQALGQGPTPREQQLKQQVGQLTTSLAEALQRHGKDALKLVGKDQMRDIDVYKAETDRIKALAPLLPTDAEGLQQMIEQLVYDSLATNLLPVLKANIKGVGEQSDEGLPPVEGAQQAPDGNWYVLDPTKRSRYLRIAPLATEGKPPAKGPQQT